MLDQAEKRESDMEVPFPGMLKALIENTANTDGDHMVTRTEFAQIIQGRPKKKIQQVRDLQLCEVRLMIQIIAGRPKKPIQQVRDLQLCEVRLFQGGRRSRSVRLPRIPPTQPPWIHPFGHVFGYFMVGLVGGGIFQFAGARRLLGEAGAHDANGMWKIRLCVLRLLES